MLDAWLVLWLLWWKMSNGMLVCWILRCSVFAYGRYLGSGGALRCCFRNDGGRSCGGWGRQMEKPLAESKAYRTKSFEDIVGWILVTALCSRKVLDVQGSDGGNKKQDRQEIGGSHRYDKQQTMKALLVLRKLCGMVIRSSLSSSKKSNGAQGKFSTSFARRSKGRSVILFQNLPAAYVGRVLVGKLNSYLELVQERSLWGREDEWMKFGELSRMKVMWLGPGGLAGINLAKLS